MNTENINLPASFRVIGVGIGIEEVIKKVKSLELERYLRVFPNFAD